MACRKFSRQHCSSIIPSGPGNTMYFNNESSGSSICLPRTCPRRTSLLQSTCHMSRPALHCKPDTSRPSCWLLNSSCLAPRQSGIFLKTHTQPGCRGRCGRCC